MTGLLAEYDAHLRTSAEAQGAREVQRHGPLWIARLAGGRLFVTYREVDDLVAHVNWVAGLISADASIVEAEWKTRTHDHTPGLEQALSTAGFVAGEPESVMLGDASTLIHAEAPDGVTIRMLTEPEEIRAALAMQDVVFGGVPPHP